VLPVAQRVPAALQASEKAGTGPVGTPTREPRVGGREFGELTPIQAGTASDPRRSTEAGAKRSVAQAVVVANRIEGSHVPSPKELADHRTRVWPALRALPLNRLMAITGLTKSACSRIPSGEVVPHRRHWESITLR